MPNRYGSFIPERVGWSHTGGSAADFDYYFLSLFGRGIRLLQIIATTLGALCLYLIRFVTVMCHGGEKFNYMYFREKRQKLL